MLGPLRNLLRTDPAIAYEVDDDNMSLLHYAVRAKSVAMIKTLLQHGIRPDICESKHVTPLEMLKQDADEQSGGDDDFWEPEFVDMKEAYWIGRKNNSRK